LQVFGRVRWQMNTSVELPKPLKDLIKTTNGATDSASVQEHMKNISDRHRRDLGCYLEAVFLTLQKKQ
jgi:hypothetical protein